jgi:poly(beta-D-mannuronate) lyase
MTKKIILIMLLSIDLLMGGFVMSKGKPLIKKDIINISKPQSTPMESESNPIHSEDENYVQTITVNSLSSLVQAVKNADISTKIILENGIYKDLNVAQLRGNSAPVLIVAKNHNAVQIQRNLEIFGNNITIKGLLFNGGYKNNSRDGLGGCVYNFGNDNRVTRCTWDDSKARRWMYSIKGDRFELDHCTFKNKYNNIDYRQAITAAIYSYQDATTPSKHHIHHNYWHNIIKGKTSNGYESLIIYGAKSFADHNTDTHNPGMNHNVLCEYNLFEKCDGEIEIISIKTPGTILQYNTIKDSAGGITLRHGRNNTIRYNHITGNKRLSYGIRVTGDNEHIYNNYINISGTSIPGIELLNGTVDDDYLAATNFNIHNNYIKGGNGVIRFGRKLNNTRTKASGRLTDNIFIQGNSPQILKFINMPTNNIISNNNQYYGTLGNHISGFIALDITPAPATEPIETTINQVGSNI